MDLAAVGDMTTQPPKRPTGDPRPIKALHETLVYLLYHELIGPSSLTKVDGTQRAESIHCSRMSLQVEASV
jgi:hypothetical protein